MRAAKKSTKIKLDEDPFAFLDEEEKKEETKRKDKKKEDNLDDFQFFENPNENMAKPKKNQKSGWSKLDVHAFPKQDLDFNKLFK